MKRFISALLIYLISFQLAFAETLLRVPASADIAYTYSSVELLKEINEFKDSIKGKDLKAACNTDEVDTLEEAVTEDNEQDLFGFSEDEIVAGFPLQVADKIGMNVNKAYSDLASLGELHSGLDSLIED